MTGALALLLAGGAIAGQQPAAAPEGQVPAPPAQHVRAPKTPEERTALQAIFQATTPDARIAAAETFNIKFPMSDFKATAYYAEAQSYQEKRDYEHTVALGEQTLDSNPDDGTKVQTLLLLANTIASNAGEYDLDLSQKMAKVEKYANGAIDMLKTMQKPNPALTDEQWEAFREDLTAAAHEALGMGQMARKDYEKAAMEFKTAVDTAKDTDPATEVRLAAAYTKAGKQDDAIAVCDKVLAMPNLHPTIRQVAQAERNIAVREKGKTQPAAPAATPAPAEAPAPAASPKP
jgi:tetratricopeptide (TPR) repeat protein